LKTSEFRRWLLKKGVEMTEGANHTKLRYNGKQSHLPRHATEIKEPLRKAILKQLNIKE